MEELSLRDMIGIFSRRRKIFFITAALVFAVALIFVLRWSNYRATATVQIEQSYITANIANPNEAMVTLADQRINQIQQKVTALESLSQVIAKFGLYPERRETTPLAALTGKMRRDIRVNFISAAISNPLAAQKQTAEQLSAIAFDLSFDYPDPVAAQQVADELVTRFLDEDLKMRRVQAQETSAFLAAQIVALETSMADQEKAIADFRAKNGESGPAALAFNQQATSTLALNIQNVESQISSNEGTQGSLRSQLALVDPYSRVVADGQVLTTPATQLKALEAQYSVLTAKYGEEHPDVIKARRQIQALKAQVGRKKPAADPQIKAQIIDLRTHLEAATNTLGADHPDVQSLQRQLKALEKKRATATAAGQGDGLVTDADNPAYLQLAAQLRASESQHRSLTAQRDSLREQQAKYENRLAAQPAVEQEMAKLTRDYENIQLRYRELKERKMAADMNEQLELGRKGQRLVVINPPAVPDSTQPRRSLLLLGGLLLSVAAGLAAVIAAEAGSQCVHGAAHLAALVGAPPLVTVPHIRSRDESDPALRLRGLYEVYGARARNWARPQALQARRLWKKALRRFIALKTRTRHG